MSIGKYILNKAGEPVEAHDLISWGRWFEKADRHVGNDTIGDSRVSTVFLGLDHCWTGGSPVLWKTMVFGGPLDQKQDRCSGSRKDAQLMHARMVRRVKKAEKP